MQSRQVVSQMLQVIGSISVLPIYALLSMTMVTVLLPFRLAATIVCCLAASTFIGVRLRMMGHLPGIMSKLLLFVKRSFFDESLVLVGEQPLQDLLLLNFMTGRERGIVPNYPHSYVCRH
mmetsp:Transcript_7064/g.18176  ORF Transcript_7064/g.18176 Transcript_7064/m.18176 type:complete len:120 (-) Transcript_7064:1441-1800(-)